MSSHAPSLAPPAGIKPRLENDLDSLRRRWELFAPLYGAVAKEPELNEAAFSQVKEELLKFLCSMSLWELYYVVGLPIDSTKILDSRCWAEIRSISKQALVKLLSARRESQLLRLKESYGPDKRIAQILHLGADWMRQLIDQALVTKACQLEDVDLIDRCRNGSPDALRVATEALLAKHAKIPGQAARKHFARYNRRLPANRRIALEELRSIADTAFYSAIDKAIKNFDYTKSRDKDLGAFVDTCVRNALIRFTRSVAGISSVGLKNQARFFRARTKLQIRYGDTYDPTNEELALQSGLTPKQVENCRRRTEFLKTELFSEIAAHLNPKSADDSGGITEYLDAEDLRVESCKSPADEAQLHELVGILDSSLQKLKESDRDILDSSFYKGMDSKSIAVKLGITHVAARKRLLDAKKRLTKIFQRDSLMGSAAA